MSLRLVSRFTRPEICPRISDLSACPSGIRVVTTRSLHDGGGENLADWRVIEYAGRTLVQLLQRSVDDVMLPTTQVDVQLASPVSFRTVPDNLHPVVTLFLYRIAEFTNMRNRPSTVLPDGSTLRQPLGLELNYLITAWGRRANDTLTAEQEAVASEHQLLGIVMRALYEHGELGNAELLDDDPPSVWSATDRLQVVKSTLPVEEYYRIWETSELPYRLSVAYQVRVVGLDETRSTAAARVVQSQRSMGRAES